MMKLSQNLLAFAVVLYVTPWSPHSKAVSKCTSRRSSFGKALQGHTFEMFKANYPSGCVIRCQNELKCQSYNYVLEEKICELNNRSKEARPEDYVTDPARIYMTIQLNRGRYFRMHLGSNSKYRERERIPHSSIPGCVARYQFSRPGFSKTG